MIGYLIVAVAGFMVGVGASFSVMYYYKKEAMKQISSALENTGMQDILDSASKSSQGMSIGDVLAVPEAQTDTSYSNPPPDLKDDVEAINEALSEEYEDDGDTFEDVEEEKKEKPVILSIDDAKKTSSGDLIGDMLKNISKDRGPPKKKQSTVRKKGDFPIKFRRAD